MIRTALLLLVLPSLAAAQWQRTEKTDAFRDTRYSQFELTGKFLTLPQHSSLTAPVMVLQCQAGDHRYGKWHTGGKFVDGYIQTGAVLNAGLGSITVQYRLDDGKIHEEPWTPSTNLGSVFFPAITLNTLMFWHFMPHKEGSGDPVRKVTVAVNEYLAAEVVMEFDMPDPGEAGDVCGVVMRKE